MELAFSPLCQQLFLYDAEGGELSCASCNPAGSRPLGPTVLPGWTNGLEGPRFLSDDGARLFFTSFDQILPADESEGGDVYEFERPGTGSCKEASGDFDPVDYREGGGFPEAPPSPPCVSSESCKAPAGTAPQPPSAATAGFRGAGNVTGPPAPCGKGRARRGGKCVNKHRAKHKRQKKRRGKRRARG